MTVILGSVFFSLVVNIRAAAILSKIKKKKSEKNRSNKIHTKIIDKNT